MKFLKRFNRTDALLTVIEQQAIGDILVENHNIFPRHIMDFGMNTKFKVKLTVKDNKAAYSQSLSRPIHLKEELIIVLALLRKNGTITVLPFSDTLVPFLVTENPKENYVFWWISQNQYFVCR